LNSLWADAFLATIVFVAGLIFAFVYFFQHVPDDWYVGRSPTPPNVFISSAMSALGHGLVLPDGTTPGLERFAQQQQMTLDAGDLPDPLTVKEVTPWEKRHRYLLTLVSLVWRVTGVTWLAVKGILAVALALTLVLVYGVMRQGMGRILSLTATYFFLTTPNLIFNTTSVRDFLKVPFFYAILLILGWLVRNPPRGIRFLAVAALLGSLIGLGLGFRHDILICLVPASAVLLLCNQDPWRTALPWKAAAIALCLLVFLMVSWPVLRDYGNSGAPAHDAMMGLVAKTEDDLGLSRTSYQRMPGNHDFLIYAMQLGYAERVLGKDTPPGYDDAEAEAIGKRMLQQWFFRYPGDFLAKACATIAWTLEGALPNYTYQVYEDFGRPFNRTAILSCALIAFMLLCAHSLRMGWLALFLLLYFTMYTGIQFQMRHVFHLAVFPLWILGFLAHQGVLRAIQARGGKLRESVTRELGALRPALFRATGSASLLIVAAVLLLGAARLYQGSRTESWLAPYGSAERAALTVDRCEAGDWVLFRVTDEELWQGMRRPGWMYREGYLVASLSGSAEERPLWLVYESNPATSPGDFSTLLEVPATAEGPGGRLEAYFPVYAAMLTQAPMPDMYFVGVALKKEDAEGFQGLSRIPDLSNFDLLPVVWLPENRQYFRPWAKLGMPYPFESPMIPPIRTKDCVPSGTTPPA
jgi:hypothetical protein